MKVYHTNKLFDEKILRNEKEDLPNVGDNEIVRTSNDEYNNEFYTILGNEWNNGASPEEEYIEQEAPISKYIKDCSDEEFKKITTQMVPNDGKTMERMTLASPCVDKNSHDHLSCKFNEPNWKI